MIREDVSHILGFVIPEGEWDSTFNAVMEAGAIDLKKITQILLLLCKRVEKLEGVPIEPPKFPTTISLYNPTKDDFTDTFDISGKGLPEQFVIHSKEIMTFGEVAGQNIRVHLINFVAAKRQINTLDIPAMSKIFDEVTVVV